MDPNDDHLTEQRSGGSKGSSKPKSHFRNKSQPVDINTIDNLISKCDKYLSNDEAKEILLLHKNCLYDDRNVEGRFYACSTA